MDTCSSWIFLVQTQWFTPNHVLIGPDGMRGAIDSITELLNVQIQDTPKEIHWSLKARNNKIKYTRAGSKAYSNVKNCSWETKSIQSMVMYVWSVRTRAGRGQRWERERNREKHHHKPQTTRGEKEARPKRQPTDGNIHTDGQRGKGKAEEEKRGTK